jgi:hypothetical protein
VLIPHGNNDDDDEDDIESDHSVSSDRQEGQNTEMTTPSVLQTPTGENENHGSEQQASSSAINDVEECMDPMMKRRLLQNRDMFGMRIPPPPLSAHLSTTAQHQTHLVSQMVGGNRHGRTSHIAMQLWKRESCGSSFFQTTRAAKLKYTMTRGFQEFCHGNRWTECESVQLTNGMNHNSTHASHYPPTIRATCLEFDEAGVLLASADATGTISIHDMDQVFCSRMQQQRTNSNGLNTTRTCMIEPVLRFAISSVSRQSIACLRWNPANQDQLAVSFM